MTVRALRSTAHRILERCDRATVESLRITEAGHRAGPLPTPRQGIGPAFLPGERGRHQVLEGRAGEQVVQGPSSHSRSRASRWTGIAEPANASSAVSIARPGSEAKTAATPSLRRRRPSARALAWAAVRPTSRWPRPPGCRSWSSGVRRRSRRPPPPPQPRRTHRGRLGGGPSRAQGAPQAAVTHAGWLPPSPRRAVPGSWPTRQCPSGPSGRSSMKSRGSVIDGRGCAAETGHR
jgi:hypothetical protein